MPEICIHYRSKFDIVRQKTLDLAAAMSKINPKTAIDIDDAGMRLTLDVVGLVSNVLLYDNLGPLETKHPHRHSQDPLHSSYAIQHMWEHAHDHLTIME